MHYKTHEQIRPQKPLSFEGLKTVPIAERGGKVRVDQFARPYQKGGGVRELLDSLPGNSRGAKRSAA